MTSQKKYEMEKSSNTVGKSTNTNAEQQDNKNYSIDEQDWEKIAEHITKKDPNNSKLDEKWQGKLEVFTENDEQDIYYVIGTPFGILHRQGTYIVMCAQNQVSEKPLHTIEEAYKDATEITWSKITMYMGIMKRLEKTLEG